jgi:molybdate transport system substrate-binding protein
MIRRHVLAGGAFGAAVLLGRPLFAQARGEAAATGPVIAAASSLQFALTELARRFTRETGHAVRPAFGSSGNFARQIRQGAPFELFFSADEAFVLDLAREGHLADEGRLYAVGRLVLLLGPTSPLQPDGSLVDLAAALADGRLRKFAIANPEHAPYGRGAREVLVHAGLWERVSSRLVLGENVAQAAQFVLSGNAEAGLVALSLALTPQVAERSRHALVPGEWHRPLRQRVAVTKRAGPVARAFLEFVLAPEGRATLARYGFTVPADAR